MSILQAVVCIAGMMNAGSAVWWAVQGEMVWFAIAVIGTTSGVLFIVLSAMSRMRSEQ